jgi:hypothetical protein
MLKIKDGLQSTQTGHPFLARYDGDHRGANLIELGLGQNGMDKRAGHGSFDVFADLPASAWSGE